MRLLASASSPTSSSSGDLTHGRLLRWAKKAEVPASGALTMVAL